MEEGEKKVIRWNSGKSFKSRVHDKAEKKKQRKEWLERKREKMRQRQHESAVEEEPRVPPTVVQEKKEKAEILSRGKKLVELSRKRKREQMKTNGNTSKRVKIPREKAPDKRHKEVDFSRLTASTPKFKELDRKLLSIDRTEAIGSGSFGRCFSATYRQDYRVVVKEMKATDSTKKELERARREVVGEATILSELGDHPGIPHLFGVCSEEAPFYLVLQYHAVEGRSLTLSKAVTTGMVAVAEDCIKILKQIGEILLFLHTKGYLHNDLKGNNVVLDGANLNPIIIDFGKSRKISKTRLLKPKVDIKKASERYPHIAPELHRGERQSIASDVYSFGALINRVLKDGKFDVPALKSAAKSCLSASPGKRPELKDILQEMGR